VGRSKKKPTEHHRGPAEAGPGRIVSGRPAPRPDPPRPSRLFLAAAGLLLLAWMAILGVLAALH